MDYEINCQATRKPNTPGACDGNGPSLRLTDGHNVAGS